MRALLKVNKKLTKVKKKLLRVILIKVNGKLITRVLTNL
jgi:hypothetical protein